MGYEKERGGTRTEAARGAEGTEKKTRSRIKAGGRARERRQREDREMRSVGVAHATSE